MQPSSAPRKASSATRDFSLRFEMTAGVLSRPSPYREQQDFSLRFEMTGEKIEMTAGVATLLGIATLLILPPLARQLAR